MSQTVRYVVYIDGTQQAVAGLNSMEGAANKTEGRLTSLNNAAKGLTSAFGFGLGLHALKRMGDDALEGAANYETAMKRIKFSSSDLADGGNNLAFIRNEADKFKIELQGTTDAYGKFLAMLAGSDIAGDKVRKLHDDLLLIGKVKGLDDGQLDAAVMNLGKMLEAGAMDARHLRPLEMQLSGIGKFIADEMGVSVHKLAILRNKGQLTGVDPSVLLSAIDKQARSLEKFLPESTETLRSGITDLHNTWLSFKNDLVLDNKEEIKAVLGTLKDTAEYLHEHKESVTGVIKAVTALGIAYVGYRATMVTVSAGVTAYNGLMSAVIGRGAAVVGTVDAQTLAFNTLAASMERVAFASELMAGASLSGAVGLGTLGIPLATAGTTTVAGATTGMTAGAAAAGGGFLAAAKSVVVPVFVTGASMAAGEAMGLWKIKDLKDWWLPDALAVEVGTSEHADQLRADYDWRKQMADMKVNPVPSDQRNPNASWSDMVTMTEGLFNTKMLDSYGVKFPRVKKDDSSGGHDKIMPPADKITGQRVVTYNIRIGEINGIRQNTVNRTAEFNERRVAEMVRDEIIGSLTDGQIRQGNW